MLFGAVLNRRGNLRFGLWVGAWCTFWSLFKYQSDFKVSPKKCLCVPHMNYDVMEITFPWPRPIEPMIRSVSLFELKSTVFERCQERTVLLEFCTYDYHPRFLVSILEWARDWSSSEIHFSKRQFACIHDYYKQPQQLKSSSPCNHKNEINKAISTIKTRHEKENRCRVFLKVY